MKRIIFFIVIAAILIFLASRYSPDFGVSNLGQEGIDEPFDYAQDKPFDATQDEQRIEAVSDESGEQVINNNENEGVTMFNIEDVTVGEGALATEGSVISVHYVGTLEDGTQFDSSRDRGMPFEFTLGAGQVIEGWDKGFAGMKVGGVRKLTIPAEMGYGERGAGSIPPNSTLLFEVELLGVK